MRSVLPQLLPEELPDYRCLRPTQNQNDYPFCNQCISPHVSITPYPERIARCDYHVPIPPSGFPRHQYRSEEHTSELQSLMRISYAVFCLKKKRHKINKIKTTKTHQKY